LPTVTIDGIKVEVEKNATILEAAQKAGVWIPTLCYHEAVSRSGACRLCMVELEGGDRKQLVTSCNYPVRHDLVVSTTSEQAVKARCGVMELLLARAPESEELKELAERMGVLQTSFPTVTESQRNCILCGLCIRVCEEVIGQSAIGFAGRGVDKAVAGPFRQPAEDCIGCGACAAICPVGTIRIRLHEEEQEIEISPFKSRNKLIVCEECGAMIISAQVSEQALRKIESIFAEFPHRLRLCPQCRKKQTAKKLEESKVFHKKVTVS